MGIPDNEIGVHMSHCNQGEYVGSCKYGDFEDCPALNDKASTGQYKNITMEMVKEYCRGTMSDFTEERLLDILTGEVALKDARDDVLSFAERK
ncbi:MAG: hypothetical protein KAT90_04380 [Gammaproteobacteria bacterium]|nr:hypothetical protein [Gammaproteobacteria bacterium]